MDVDPSLPLDNLDENILCADALFTDWPEIDTIVGNPPFLGGSKIRSQLGVGYLQKLQDRFPGFLGTADLCALWFRKAHEYLRPGCRAGLVATSIIRVGSTREAALDFIAANGGTITNAVSSRIWPGESAVNVSMVNWVRGPAEGPHDLIVEDRVYPVQRIPTHLQLYADVSVAKDLAVNPAGMMTEGVKFGHEAFRSGSTGFPISERGKESAIRPVATGDDLLRGRLSVEPEYCIFIARCATETDAHAQGNHAFAHLKRIILPWLEERAGNEERTKHYSTWIRRWWQPQGAREEFFELTSGLRRVIACPRVQARGIFCFLSTTFVSNNTMKLFAHDDDYTFGMVASSCHWEWTKAKASKVRADIQYTTEVWTTFPWPQEPTTDQVTSVAAAGRELRRVRTELMNQNDWSLRQLYQAAEVEGPHPLKDAQLALDVAVRDAYGVPDSQDAIEFLLELNLLVAEDEAQGRKVRGPGLPDQLDPKDPRWFSTDCIEPPSVEN